MKVIGKKAFTISAFFYFGMSISAMATSVDDGLAALDDKKFDEAVKIFDAAYKEGEVDAGFYLGRIFELGVGTDVNWPVARAIYKDAAGKGSAKALNRVGLMYFRGEPGELQSYAKAQEAMCEAADKGEKEAQFNCGDMIKQGLAGVKDADRAHRYFELAAKQHHVGAINKLGYAYLNGENTKKDIAKAKSYFERSAEQGNPIGLFEIAKIYEQGLTVEKDISKAHLYYNLSGARGYVKAREGLERITLQMSPQQLINAQESAQSWKAKIPNEKTKG